MVYLGCLIGPLTITSFTDLMHTNRGVTCSERGLHDLSSEQECADAVKFAKSFNVRAKYDKSVLDPGYPYGCYIHSDLKYPGEYGDMHFNHWGGLIRGKNTNVISICKIGNIYF